MAKAKPKAEVSYAHRSRIEKLGVKRAHRVLVLGVRDAAFTAELRRTGAHVSRREDVDADLIFFAAEDRAVLGSLAALRTSITRDGAIWVIRPRASDAISEADVMSAGHAADLVDVKVARFSETHSALKFVIPVSKR